MFVQSDVQSLSTIHVIYLDTNRQHYYVHTVQYETNRKRATL